MLRHCSPLAAQRKNDERKDDYMGREYSEYRDVLADIIAHFGDKAWITVDELSKYDGSCAKTIKKRYQIPKGINGINRNVLARRICQLAHGG